MDLKYTYYSLVALIALTPSVVQGEALTDGTMGAIKSLSGNFTVPQDLGTLKGQNLFHSFRTFNIRFGESATFTGQSSIQNVISRVTGSQSSEINGLLKSEIGNADFYFINPNGVMFGPGAQIDVPAAFHVSTANEIRFPDGATFSASNLSGSSLSVEQPEAYGFLGDQSGEIMMQLANIEGKPNSEVDVVGRNITSTYSTISAESGSVRISATGTGNVEVPIVGASEAVHGTIDINHSTIDSSGNGGGKIVVRGGDVLITGTLTPNGGILANNTGDRDADSGVMIQADNLTVQDFARIRSNNDGLGHGGNIDISVTGDMTVTDSTIRAAALAPAQGNTGSINVIATNLSIDRTKGGETAINTVVGPNTSISAGDVAVAVSDKLSLNNSATIYSDSYGAGNTGSVTVSAGDIDLNNGGWIEAGNWQNSTGSTGQVSVNATGNIVIQNNGSISTQTIQPTSKTDSGLVTVDAGGNLALSNGGTITTATSGQADAGSINIAAESITMNGKGSLTGIYSITDFFSSGNAGSVTVTSSNQLDITDGAVIKNSTGTYSLGNGGEIAVKAGEISIDGKDGSKLTGISSSTLGFGKGGNVYVEAVGHLSIFDGANIASFPSFFPSGDAGNITVRSNSTTIDAGTNQAGLTGIYSAPSDSLLAGYYGAGKAGAVDAQANGLMEILNGGTIFTSSFGQNDAGQVHVSAGTLKIQGSDEQSFTGIYANSFGNGSGGDLEIESNGNIWLLHGGTIDTSTSGSGEAGNISVTTNELYIDGWRTRTLGNFSFTEPSGIFSKAEILSSGQTGNIDIVATQNLSLSNIGGISIANNGTSPASTSVASGQININAPSINLDNAIITAEATGNIDASLLNIKSNTLLLDNSSITTTATNGNGGPISVDSRLTRLRNSEIQTSVKSQTNGNGGDINVAGDILILDTGFIQANTAAPKASGGDINVGVQALIPSGNALLIGGDIPLNPQRGSFGYNVIQAAAPDGVNGTITIGAPQLNLSGSIAKLAGAPLDLSNISQDYCASGIGSSLTRVGNGGLLPSAKDPAVSR